MSLILDAINRSDQERADERPVPGLQSHHGPETGDGERRWSTPWLVTIGVLIIALLAVVLWPVPEPPMEAVAAPEEVASGAQEPVVQPVSRPEPAPAATPVEPVVRAEPAEEPAATDPEIESLYVEAQRPVPKPLPEDRSLPRAGRLPPEMTERPVSEPVPEEEAASLDVDAITDAAQQELAAPAYADSDLPLVNELNQRTRDEIPSIFFSEHTWSPDASASVVTLNGERRQEGDRVAPGLTLVEILENSIVLDFRGTRFRLRSLNSWVNL